ncbi:MAG: alpha/beta hydrolase-fold protein [Gemmataceae bacterium]
MSGKWQRIEIAGKAADLLEPAAGPPRFGVLFLHGHDQLTLPASSAISEALLRQGLACVCPHGQRCWWTDRVCPEFDPAISTERFVLESVVPFAHDRWALGPLGLGLLGYCMGGQGALRLAFKQPNAFPVVAAIAPAIEYHELYWSGTPIDEMYASKEQCRQDTVPMHIHPSQFPPHIFFAADPTDPWRRGSDRLREKMAALGVPHECDLVTRAGGHSWAYLEHMAPRALTFLAAGLERESRRLI